MRRLLLCVVMALLLSGCGGGTSSTAPVPVGGDGTPASAAAAQALQVVVQLPSAPQAKPVPLTVTVYVEDPDTYDEIVPPTVVTAEYGRSITVDVPGVPAGEPVVVRSVVDDAAGTEILSDSEAVRQPAAGTVVRLVPETPPVNAAGTWATYGPAPVFDYFNVVKANCTGRISALLVDPSDARRIFVGAASGGVWSSIDGGASWTAIAPAMESTAVGAMCFDPTDATRNTIYVGTGEARSSGLYGGGIFRLTRAGAVSKVVGSEIFARKAISGLSVRPDGTIAAGVYRLATYGITTDEDFGVFVKRPGQAAFVNAFTDSVGSALPVVDIQVRAATTPNGKETWFAAVDTYNTLGLTSDGGIYRSADSGATWARLEMKDAEGSPVVDLAKVGRIELALAPSRPAVMYALVGATNRTFQGIFVSADGGDTWRKVTADPDPSLLLAYESGGKYFAQSNYNLAIAVDPASPTDLYAGGTRPLRLGGVDLESGAASSVSLAVGDGFQQDDVHPHVDHHAMVCVRVGAETSLFTGCDGGLWRLDGARTAAASTPWVNLNGQKSFLETLQMYSVAVDPADNRVLIGGMQDNGSAASVANRLWTAVRGGDGGATRYDGTRKVGYATVQWTRGRLYRLSKVTHVNGKFTSRLSASRGLDPQDDAQFIPPLALAPSDGRLALGSVRVYESFNGGDDWVDISGALSSARISAIAYKPDNPAVMYVGQANGGLWRTTDATREAAFQNVYRAPLVGRSPITAIAVDPADATGDTAYVAQGNFTTAGQLFRTLNGGRSWERFTDGLPDAPVMALALCSQVKPALLFAGNDRGVYYLPLDGRSTTWKPFGTLLPNVMVRALELSRKKVNDTMFLVAGTWGRGTYQIPITAEARAQTPVDALAEQSDSDSNDTEDKAPTLAGDRPGPEE